MYLAIIILPLLGSIVSGFFGRKIGITRAQIITCTAVITITVLAVIAFFEVGLNNIPVAIEVFRWMDFEWLIKFFIVCLTKWEELNNYTLTVLGKLLNDYSINYSLHSLSSGFYHLLFLFICLVLVFICKHKYYGSNKMKFNLIKILRNKKSIFALIKYLAKIMKLKKKEYLDLIFSKAFRKIIIFIIIWILLVNIIVIFIYYKYDTPIPFLYNEPIKAIILYIYKYLIIKVGVVLIIWSVVNYTYYTVSLSIFLENFTLKNLVFCLTFFVMTNLLISPYIVQFIMYIIYIDNSLLCGIEGIALILSKVESSFKFKYKIGTNILRITDNYMNCKNDKRFIAHCYKLNFGLSHDNIKYLRTLRNIRHYNFVKNLPKVHYIPTHFIENTYVKNNVINLYSNVKLSKLINKPALLNKGLLFIRNLVHKEVIKCKYDLNNVLYESSLLVELPDTKINLNISRVKKTFCLNIKYNDKPVDFSNYVSKSFVNKVFGNYKEELLKVTDPRLNTHLQVYMNNGLTFDPNTGLTIHTMNHYVNDDPMWRHPDNGLTIHSSNYFVNEDPMWTRTRFNNQNLENLANNEMRQHSRLRNYFDYLLKDTISLDLHLLEATPCIYYDQFKEWLISNSYACVEINQKEFMLVESLERLIEINGNYPMREEIPIAVFNNRDMIIDQKYGMLFDRLHTKYILIKNDNFIRGHINYSFNKWHNLSDHWVKILEKYGNVSGYAKEWQPMCIIDMTNKKFTLYPTKLDLFDSNVKVPVNNYDHLVNKHFLYVIKLSEQILDQHIVTEQLPVTMQNLMYYKYKVEHNLPDNLYDYYSQYPRFYIEPLD